MSNPKTWDVTVTFADGAQTRIKDAHSVETEGSWVVVKRYDDDRFGDVRAMRSWRYPAANVLEISQL